MRASISRLMPRRVPLHASARHVEDDPGLYPFGYVAALGATVLACHLGRPRRCRSGRPHLVPSRLHALALAVQQQPQQVLLHGPVPLRPAHVGHHRLDVLVQRSVQLAHLMRS